jgi:hypothetical protein
MLTSTGLAKTPKCGEPREWSGLSQRRDAQSLLVLTPPGFPRRGRVLEVLHVSLRTWEHQALVAGVGPPHQVRRAPIGVAHLKHLRMPHRLAETSAGNDEPVSNRRKHHDHIPSRWIGIRTEGGFSPSTGIRSSSTPSV